MLILYVVVIIGLRIMGKRQIGDMQPNELVTTILISEIATMPVQDINQPVVNGLIAIAMLIVLEVALSVITLKSEKARAVVNGRPVIVIRHGKIDQSALQKLRMTLDDLLENLRQSQVFDVDTVEYAIVETNGHVSVMLKPSEQPITPEIADIHVDDDGIPVPLICDGRVQRHFMESLKVSEETLNRILDSNGVTINRVFLMTVDSSGNVVVIKRSGDEE